jgi:hypothetical protein
MVSATEIVRLQDGLTREWHGPAGAEHDGLFPAPAGPDSKLGGKPSGADESHAATVSRGSADGEWLGLVARQHWANFDLWHIEDEARTPGASDAEIADVKRRIDETNQVRNDLMEGLDRALQSWVEERGLPSPAAPLHSESPGQMIDRLSILALKIYHTREEAERRDAPPGHAERNRERLKILLEQREDLAGCLDALWQETLGGTRRFKVYRQLKMYNDPTLNPAIYGKSGGSRRG